MQNKSILILVAFVVAASGCSSSTTTSQEDPAAVAEAYSSDITGPLEDLESAHDRLSSDVKENTDYPSYDTEITSVKSATTGQGATKELLQTETIQETNETAKVNLTYQTELVQGGAFNEELTMDLVYEDGTWKVDEVFNPYGS